jgi:4'-phosphopantetheinyl transferase EntD
MSHRVGQGRARRTSASTTEIAFALSSLSPSDCSTHTADQLPQRFKLLRQERDGTENFSMDRIANIIFSAKECVYKCIWPHLRRIVGHQEVDMGLDYEAQRFWVNSHANVHHRMADISGGWRMVGSTVVAVTILDST